MERLALKFIRPNPNQPRKQFEVEKLEELRQSIERYGVLQPIVVRKATGYYEIIAGERRFQAAKLAGKEDIPALVVTADSDRVMELALIENIQRADLNAIEEAVAYEQLMQTLGLTQQQLADRVGKSRSHVTNSLRLLRLPSAVQHAVMVGDLTMGHARAITGMKSEQAMEQIAKRVIAEHWTVRRLERYLQKERTEKDAEAIERRYRSGRSGACGASSDGCVDSSTPKRRRPRVEVFFPRRFGTIVDVIIASRL